MLVLSTVALVQEKDSRVLYVVPEEPLPEPQVTLIQTGGVPYAQLLVIPQCLVTLHVLL